MLFARAGQYGEELFAGIVAAARDDGVPTTTDDDDGAAADNGSVVNPAWFLDDVSSAFFSVAAVAGSLTSVQNEERKIRQERN
jgi:hypothetical protein